MNPAPALSVCGGDQVGKPGAGPNFLGRPLHGLGERVSPELIGDDAGNHADGGFHTFRMLVLAVSAEQFHHCSALGYRQRGHACLMGLVLQRSAPQQPFHALPASIAASA